MNLKEKLARLERLNTTPGRKAPSREGTQLSSLLPGELAEDDGLPVWRIRTVYPLEHQHGRVTLGEFPRNSPDLLALVARLPQLRQSSCDHLVFMDTETSGLAGGVGTFAFLVGLGYFTDDAFVIDQYFMRHFQEEAGILQRFWDLIRKIAQEGGALVTFNGKTFDVPLLVNRAIFLRLLRAQPEFCHVDLLHPARRVWKKHLPDCTLQTLERKILAQQRHGDVPGHLIPELYFRFLRDGDPRPLFPVFYHNRMDILTLVGVLHVLMNLHTTDGLDIPADVSAVAANFHVSYQLDAGIRFLESRLARGVERTEAKAALLHLAGFYKRKGDFPKAIAYWEKAIQLPGFSAEPFEELAKIYEHRLKDLAKARHYTLRALENVRTMQQLRPSTEIQELRDRLLWRLRRLERKTNNG